MKRAGFFGFALGILIAMAVTRTAPALEPGGIRSARESEILALEAEQAEELETLALLHAAEQEATESKLVDSEIAPEKKLTEIQALLGRQKSERQDLQKEQKEAFCSQFGIRCISEKPGPKRSLAQSAI